ncbi:hypothetical protein EHQ68_08695 [Leptospira congkakensis]|uniref:Uncharacterized protein n=1 Tax=Leptospira congkakensis TaxID=2484932 RepID=A0A4Z1AJG7_9LEPT|nr:hypothetical protein [Leptospira congkakensis]TGL88708.1 hypothetical protein EHQ69_14765 [Leptospira congkakensis]TGL89294.1 hypothetical protein EHQ68_08695 [Leptospira congkakensis]TGL97262.1 hypothetical protein EHQ70_08190 [Leptospira congkakensis]
MLEIRYYVKQILNFPTLSVDLQTLSLDALWFDALLNKRKENLSPIFEKPIDSLPNINTNIKATHAILAYVLFDPDSKIPEIDLKKLRTYLLETIPALCALVNPYTEWMKDAERAEELVRSLFQTLDLLPANETKTYFEDRFRSIDSRERIRILEQTKIAQERAKEILRQMKQKEEEEAASKYNRE